MAGHSHWKSIKHKKAANDAKRGKVWSKIARIIIVAAKSGSDPSQNLSLRYAIDTAKAANMPRDTIEKAIKKGSGELGSETYEQVLYEGYGPKGIAIMAEALTDNRHRTGPEIKKIFERGGGALGTSGCVHYLFSKKGVITVKTGSIDEDSMMEIALAAGADDMQTTGDVYSITCDPAAYEGLKRAIEEKKIPVESSEIAMVPQNTIPIDDPEVAAKILAMMEAFDDHDDIQNVYSNFDIPDEIMAKINPDA